MSKWLVLHLSLVFEQETDRRICVGLPANPSEGVDSWLFWSAANKTAADRHVCEWVWGSRWLLGFELGYCRLQLLHPYLVTGQWLSRLCTHSWQNGGMFSLAVHILGSEQILNRANLQHMSPAGWARSGGRRSQEMQRDPDVGRSRRCSTSWPRSSLCPTVSAPALTRPPSWGWSSATSAWENCLELVSM